MSSVAQGAASALQLIPFTLPTRFPPSYGGERAFFGAALFSQLLISLAAGAGLIEIYRAWRPRKEPLRHPIGLNRAALIGILLGTLFLALPSAIFNLTWGELEPEALLHIRRFQVACQAVAFIPFMLGMSALVVGREVVTFQLIKDPIPTSLLSNRTQLLHAARLGALCFLISFGVAYAK